MSSRDIILQFVNFFLFVAAQILLVRNFVLFDTAFCFIYVGFILLLPLEIGSVLMLFLAFCTGLLVDLFYDTTGIHAAASVLIAFLRPQIIRMITPRGGYEGSTSISVKAMGLDWFLPYAVTLIFIHHTALFLIEASNLSLFWHAAIKAVCSTLFTGTLLLILQYFRK
jgi:hypothetical protein